MKINVASRLYFIILLFHIIAFKFFTHFNNSQSLHKFFSNYTIFHSLYSFKNSILITNSNTILFLFITLFIIIYSLHDSFQIVPFSAPLHSLYSLKNSSVQITRKISNHKASIQFHPYLNSLIHYIRILHTILSKLYFSFVQEFSTFVKPSYRNTISCLFNFICIKIYSSLSKLSHSPLHSSYPVNIQEFLSSISRKISNHKYNPTPIQLFHFIDTILHSPNSSNRDATSSLQIQIHFHQYLILKNLSFQIVYTISFSTPIFSTPKNPESPPSSWKNNSRRDGSFH